MNQRDAIYTGARMAMDGAKVSDKARGRAYERIDALLAIRALNVRATNEWTRQNNAGRTTPGAEAASDRKQQRAWDTIKGRFVTVAGLLLTGRWANMPVELLINGSPAIDAGEWVDDQGVKEARREMDERQAEPETMEA